MSYNREDLVKELWNCRNELCLRCRKYENAYLGACNDCQYNDENMKEYEASTVRKMTNKEAIKYLITPTATSTEPSAEYLKQKEAYELAIMALKFIDENFPKTFIDYLNGEQV